MNTALPLPAIAATDLGGRVLTDSAMSESLAIADRTDQMRELMWRRLPHALALTMALCGSHYLVAIPIFSEFGPSQVAFWWIATTFNVGPGLVLIVGALTAAQIWIDDARQRYLVMAVMIATISPAGALFGSSVTWLSLVAGDFLGQLWGSRGTFLHLLWWSLLTGILLAAFYEWQRRGERTSAALARARLAAEQLERQTLQSRLNGIKARVDPEFLFAVIARVETLYPSDISAAERLLEQLIVFLRASMPRTVESATTIDQELQLCESYLQIEQKLRSSTTSFRMVHDKLADSSRFAPSVLLPLVKALLPQSDAKDTATHIYIRTWHTDQRNRIELERQALLVPPSLESIETARLALRAIFGSAAEIALTTDPAFCHRILIEVPHADSLPGDRN